MRCTRFGALTLTMIAIASLSPADRFSDLMEGLFEDVAAAAPLGWVPIPLIKLLWRRLRRMSRLFASVWPGSAPARFRPRAVRAAAPHRPARRPRRTRRTGCVRWTSRGASGGFFR